MIYIAHPADMERGNPAAGHPVVQPQVVVHHQINQPANQPGQFMAAGNGPNQNMFKKQRFPLKCRCNNCHQEMVTKIKTAAGTLQWIGCLILLFLGFW